MEPNATVLTSRDASLLAVLDLKALSAQSADELRNFYKKEVAHLISKEGAEVADKIIARFQPARLVTSPLRHYAREVMPKPPVVDELDYMSSMEPAAKAPEVETDQGDDVSALEEEFTSTEDVGNRKQMLSPKVLETAEVVRKIEPMLRRIIGDGVEIETRCAADAGFIRMDPGQIEQILMNVVLNARDAMPEGGRLMIGVEAAEVCGEDLREHPGARPGPHVVLSIRYSGTGITPETIERIFDTFFMTKEKGKGPGIGLATVYAIVQQGGGHIRVQSEPDRGSTFRIFLPSVEPERGVAAPPPRVANLRSSETVLLVEEEQVVRTLAREVLARHGYTVLEAASPKEALRAARSHPGPIHLLLTDVVMPEMNGPELAERIREDRPEVRVLYMSGYSESTASAAGLAEPGIARLNKPFTPEMLAADVRKVLKKW